MELLLTVEDHFLIKGRGLIVTPVLDYPDNGIRPFLDQVAIRSPDRDEITLTAEFDPELFTIGRADDPRSLDPHVTIMFPEGTKELIPIGSQVFVTQQLLQYLRGELHTDVDSVTWLNPWSAIKDSKTRLNIERELYRELSKGHVLFRQPMRVIGRRQDRDDFLFEFGLSSQLGVVHLSFNSKPEPPPFPTTNVYRDITEFIGKRMKPDHEEFTSVM